MLNLNQIYTAKSSATVAIRKAIARNQCVEGEYEARKVEGGFQIFKVVTETPEPVTASAEIVTEPDETVIDNPVEPITPKAPTATEIPERQLAVLNAFMGAKSLESKAANERADVWFALSDVYNSNNPHNLPKPAVPGIVGALKRKHLIKTDWGKDENGKRAIVVAITEAGIATLQAA